MEIRFDELPTELDNCVNSVIKAVNEDSERALAEIIENFDFIVGSIECKHKLMSMLPEANVIVTSRFIGEPNAIFAVKKFHIIDYYRYLHESEERNDNQG